MTTTPKGTWTQNDNDDFDIVIDAAATATSIDMWTTSRYEKSANSVAALGNGTFRGQLAWVNLPSPGYAVSWNGSSWQPLNRQLSGSVTITPSAANTPTSVTVSFPTGYFSSAPRMSLVPATSNPTFVDVSVSNTTASSVDIVMVRSNTTSTSVQWVATQTV